MNKENISRYYWFVIASGVLSGLLVFGGQIFADMGVSLYEMSILPLIFSAILLFPFILLNNKYRLRISNIWIWLLYGFMAAATILGQYAAVIVGLPVVMVVLFLYTQPIWTILFSSVFMKEKPTKWEIISLFVVLLGMVILVNPFSQSLASINWTGTVIALLAGISLSGWIIVGSYLSKAKNEPVTSVFAETIFTTALLSLSYPLISIWVKDPAIINFSFKQPLNIWVYFLLFNIFAMTLNHLVYLEGVKKVRTVDAGIIMLLEPVSAAILSVLFLSQAITLNMFIGGLLILIANYLTIREPKLKGSE